MKHGLRTFPLPVDLDDSVKLVEAEFGIEGFAVVIKLHQAIYARGYYMKWDIDTELLFMRDYCLSAVGRSLLSEIVSCCIRRGVFESTMFEKYRILTSRRIQETFLTATKRNTEVVFNKDYALDVVYTFIQNADKNGKNVNIFFKNADSLYAECDKRKEKKIKENKRNIYASSETPTPAKTVQNLIMCNGRNFSVTQDMVDELAPLYPAVDIEQELRKMQGWLLGNPRNRKTEHGMMRFVTSWLGKEQDRAAGGNGRAEKSDGKRARKTGTEREYSSEELNALFDNLDDVKV